MKGSPISGNTICKAACAFPGALIPKVYAYCTNQLGILGSLCGKRRIELCDVNGGAFYVIFSWKLWRLCLRELSGGFRKGSGRVLEGLPVGWHKLIRYHFSDDFV